MEKTVKTCRNLQQRDRTYKFFCHDFKAKKYEAWKGFASWFDRAASYGAAVLYAPQVRFIKRLFRWSSSISFRCEAFAFRKYEAQASEDACMIRNFSDNPTPVNPTGFFVFSPKNYPQKPPLAVSGKRSATSNPCKTAPCDISTQTYFHTKINNPSAVAGFYILKVFFMLVFLFRLPK